MQSLESYDNGKYFVFELLRAARFCRKAHQGQFRAHGSPYYWHPIQVARMLWEVELRDLPALQAALLHDVVEDCGVSISEIEKHFGQDVSFLVDALTKPADGESENYFYKIKQAGPIAMTIKKMDRTHNNEELKFLSPDDPKHKKAQAKTLLMRKIFS